MATVRNVFRYLYCVRRKRKINHKQETLWPTRWERGKETGSLYAFSLFNQDKLTPLLPKVIGTSNNP
jgi:hypothetical protein